MELIYYFLAIFMFCYRAEACDGYTLRVRKLENCDDSSVLKFHNANVTLTEDCLIKPAGCVENTKEAHSATVTYTVTKNMIPFTGTKDICKTLGSVNEDATVILDLFALPSSCPIKKGKLCNDKEKSVDITKYKRRLPLLVGDIQATVKIQSDAGHSCIQFKGSISKKINPKLSLLG